MREPRNRKNVNEKNFNPELDPEIEILLNSTMQERERKNHDNSTLMRVNRKLTNLGRDASHYIPVSSSFGEKYPCKSPSSGAKLDQLKKWLSLFTIFKKNIKNNRKYELLFFLENRKVKTLYQNKRHCQKQLMIICIEHLDVARATSENLEKLQDVI